MIATVVNLTDGILNGLDQIDSLSTDLTGSAQLLAIGGSRTSPLPYPFGHIVLQANGAAADADTSILPMNPRDWHYKPVYGMPHEPGEQWAALVQAGTVSITLATQTDVVDPEASAMDTI